MKTITGSNVVEFVQSERKTKTFRLGYPVSEGLREVMALEIFEDYKKYALNLCYEDYLPLLKEFVDEYDLRGEKGNSLLQQLFWWRMFYESSLDFKDSSMGGYILENAKSLSKRPFVKSWLRECSKQVPKFYFVVYRFSPTNLKVMDLVTAEMIDVVIFYPTKMAPNEGEILLGTLMPLGGGVHFPIADFYHFDVEACKQIEAHFHYYYDRLSQNSTIHEAFIHILSAMLQIERYVFLEKLEINSSNIR